MTDNAAFGKSEWTGSCDKCGVVTDERMGESGPFRCYDCKDIWREERTPTDVHGQGDVPLGARAPTPDAPQALPGRSPGVARGDGLGDDAGRVGAEGAGDAPDAGAGEVAGVPGDTDSGGRAPSTDDGRLTYLVPIGPTLYADLVVDTEHADAAIRGIEQMIPPASVTLIHERIREVVRRAYVDGLRDGFVQGVVEREHRPAEWGERVIQPESEAS